MPHELTEPITPDVMNPAPLGKLSGDWNDDDAGAYEDDFQHAPEGPLVFDGVKMKERDVKPTTRLLTRSVLVGDQNNGLGNAAPVLLLPADINRECLNLTFKLLGVVPGSLIISIAGQGSDVRNGQRITLVSTATVLEPMFSLYLGGHTGAIWAWAPDNNIGGVVPVAGVYAEVTAVSVTV